MSEALEALIRDHIQREGPMPFGAFMQMALYHPRFGYYAAGDQRTGWHGHFVTSPELDPAFGELWTWGFEQIWEACGRPPSFSVVEIGPGEGSFAAAVTHSASVGFRSALSYTLVERVARVERRQRARLENISNVSWVSSLDEVERIEAGVVFANEILDNLPVHIVEKREGQLMEACIEVADGKLVTTRRPPAGSELEDFVARCGVEIPDGHLFEVGLSTESFCARAAAIVERGAVVLVDYGTDALEQASKPRGSLVCFSESGADDEPLERVGEKDITVFANWTAVGNTLRAAGMKVVGPRLQTAALRALGLREMDEQLRDEYQRAVDEKRGADAVRAVSRRQALGTLADPGGLGGLDVVVGVRDIETPAFMQS